MRNGAVAKLVKDFKLLIDDAEGLIKSSATEARSRIEDLRHRLEKNLKIVKTRPTSANKTWLETVEDAKMQTESYLHMNTPGRRCCRRLESARSWVCSPGVNRS